MQVLVVGGAGYIGSHTCKALARAGHNPIVYDNLSFGHADAVRWGPLEIGDIFDGDRLREVICEHNPDIVIHFAAFAYVGESVIDPAKYYRNNVGGTLSLIDAMRNGGVSRIIFSSTCATYGMPSIIPIDEKTPQRPINPYGHSKLMVEQVLRDYGQAYGLEWVVLRYFNAAGCDPEGELGERHNPETHAIPLALLSALGRGPRFQVFGNDYSTPDGTAIRDYVHVSDLATAHVKAAEYLLAGGVSDAFNLATGKGTSVLELLSAVERASGRAVPMDFAPRRPGDPPQLVATGTKAQKILNWEPQYYDIDAIVDTAAPWFMR